MTPPSVITTALGTLLGTAAVLVWRVKETQKPLSLAKIILPPLGMSTGLCMFLQPECRVPWLWAGAAFLLGSLVFSYPMIATTQLSVQADGIYMKRSKAFLLTLLALAAVRLALRGYLDHLISPKQTVGLAFILALGMILRWRWTVLARYQRLSATFQPASLN